MRAGFGRCTTRGAWQQDRLGYLFANAVPLCSARRALPWYSSRERRPNMRLGPTGCVGLRTRATTHCGTRSGTFRYSVASGTAITATAGGGHAGTCSGDLLTTPKGAATARRTNARAAITQALLRQGRRLTPHPSRQHRGHLRCEHRHLTCRPTGPRRCR